MTKTNTTLKDLYTEKSAEACIDVRENAIFVTTPMGDGNAGVALELRDGMIALLVYTPEDPDLPFQEFVVKSLSKNGK